MPFAHGAVRELFRTDSTAMQIVRACGLGPETEECGFVHASPRHPEDGRGTVEFEQHAGKIEDQCAEGADHQGLGGLCPPRATSASQLRARYCCGSYAVQTAAAHWRTAV